MPKVKMVSDSRHHYNTRALKSGDEFECESDSEADDLEALKMAHRAPAKKEQPQRRQPQYARRDLTAEPAGTASEPEAPAKE